MRKPHCRRPSGAAYGRSKCSDGLNSMKGAASLGSIPAKRSTAGELAKTALYEAARPNCCIDRLAISQDETASNHCVKHLAPKCTAFINGETCARANVLAVVGIARVKINDGQIGVETDCNASL